MHTSSARNFSYAALTTLAALALIECGSAAAERTVLARTLPTPSPSSPPVDFDGDPTDPALLARWGGRIGDSPPPAPPPSAQLILQEDATKGWRLPRGRTVGREGIRYRINRHGMRGPEPARAPGAARLLTLGDSSIFGDTVEEPDVFSRIAAPQLAAAWGCPVVDINGGVPGYTSAQALTWMRESWATAQPRVVIMGTMWSDIYPEDGRPRTARRLRRLATYRVLRMLLAPWLSSQKVRWIDGQDDLVADDAEAAVPLPAYLDNLRQAAAFAQERGAEVVFLALPAPVDLDRAPVPEIIEEYRAAMAAVAAQTGSRLVDGPAWVAREGGGLSLFNDNVHPSAAGHALLGYAVAQELADLPDPCPSP